MSVEVCDSIKFTLDGEIVCAVMAADQGGGKSLVVVSGRGVVGSRELEIDGNFVSVGESRVPFTHKPFAPLPNIFSTCY